MYLAEGALKKEKLEQLAFKFERKSVLREGYLNEMIADCQVQVGASVKCQEARGHLCGHPCSKEEFE